MTNLEYLKTLKTAKEVVHFLLDELPMLSISPENAIFYLNCERDNGRPLYFKLDDNGNIRETVYSK